MLNSQECVRKYPSYGDDLIFEMPKSKITFLPEAHHYVLVLI